MRSKIFGEILEQTPQEIKDRVEEKVEKMLIIKSLEEGIRQDQLIKNILDLHNKGNPIDLDLTYSKGVFYKSGLLQQPVHKVDLNEEGDGIINCDFVDTPFENESIKSIMFDPPFVISGKTASKSKDGSCVITKRFTAYHSWQELKDSYKGALTESYRILEDNGIMIVKCQNQISSGKQHFSHYYVLKTCLELGFYPLDEFVVMSKSKMTSFGGRWHTQQHAMKMHSYFLVFKKRKAKVNYD